MKRRAWLNRRTRLKRGDSRLKRTPLASVNMERQKKREEDGLIYGAHHEWTANQPCLIHDHPDHREDCTGGGDSHHVTSIGAGGADKKNTVPLCRIAHTEVHAIGRETWEKRYGVDLREKAHRTWYNFWEEMK